MSSSLHSVEKFLRRAHDFGNYQPLDQGVEEFRVIDVEPAERRTATVRCHLRHVKMSSDPKPRYETISYVWGDPGKRAFVKLDGQTIDVPVSSAAAIRRMRLAKHSRALWIDAICINQSDLAERERQVAMMRDIYRNSQGNLIYLGQDKDPVATEQALKNMRAILKEMNEETDGLRLVKDTVFDPRRKFTTYAETGSRCPGKQIRSASSIFNLPWFR